MDRPTRVTVKLTVKADTLDEALTAVAEEGGLVFGETEFIIADLSGDFVDGVGTWTANLMSSPLQDSPPVSPVINSQQRPSLPRMPFTLNL